MTMTSRQHNVKAYFLLALFHCSLTCWGFSLPTQKGRYPAFNSFRGGHSPLKTVNGSQSDREQDVGFSLVDASAASKVSATAAADYDLSSAILDVANDDNVAASSSPKKQSTKEKIPLWKRVVTSRIFLAALAFTVGHRTGSDKAQARLLSIQETIEKTASFCAEDAKVHPFPYLASALLLFFFLREAWRAIPPWVQPELMELRSLLQPQLGNDKDENETSNLQMVDYSSDGLDNTLLPPDDMAKMRILSHKLRALADLATVKLKNSTAEHGRPVTWIDLVVLVKVLTNHLRDERAVDRDRRYTDHGTDVPNPATVLKGMDEVFELADLAYKTNSMELRQCLQSYNFTALVRYEDSNLPGTVAHYMALDPHRKLAVLSIRGSTTFADLLTDLCMRAVPYQLVGPFVEGGPTTVWAHDGISLATRRLANEFEYLVEELLFPSGYKLIITGHSLGASVAAGLGMVLRSRLGRRHPTLLRDQGDKIEVIGFACPPLLDLDAALACKPFTKSIINNSDVIPRWSISNALVLMECLKKVSQQLEEKRTRPTDLRSLIAFLRLVLTKRDKETQPPFLTMEEARNTLVESYEKVALRDPDHLYVPGQVIQMYDLWSKEGYYTNRKNRDKNREKASFNGDVTVDEVAQDPPLRVAERVHISDGTSKVLRYIEIDPRMTRDHYSDSYRSSIRDLLSIAS